PNAAAVPMASATMSVAPCCSGELASEASTAARKVMTLPGITLLATADSWASSIAEPVTSIMLGAGEPAGPGRVSIGMTTKAPPPGWAGVLLRMPATRTLNGPIGYSELSRVAPAPRMAAADGEASTGTVAPKDSAPPGAVP